MKNNKGFTIVELVIVIAVVAILAAVLIPTFAGIVKQANISADVQTARNMGTILAGEKPIGPREAVDALKANGIERLHPKTKPYSFFWIKSINAVVLTAEGVRPIYPEELTTWPFDPYDWFDLTYEYAKTEPETEEKIEAETPPATEEETTAPPPEFVTVTYICNNPEYIKQSLETDTIKYGGECRIQINVADEGQYVIVKYGVYKDGKLSHKNNEGSDSDLGYTTGFGSSWGELRQNVEVYIHVVEYCTIRFDGDGIKSEQYKNRGLRVEWGTDTVLTADYLREKFIPDGYEIESVLAITEAGEIELTDVYDPARQELRLTNVTENITVTFEFRKKQGN